MGMWCGRMSRTGCQSVGGAGVGAGLRRNGSSVKCDIRKCGMQRVEPFDRYKSRSCCGSNRPTRASMEKKTL